MPLKKGQRLIHLLVPHPQGRVRGDDNVQLGAPCDPKNITSPKDHNGHGFTNDPNHVSCEKCIQTSEFQLLWKDWHDGQEYVAPTPDAGE